jgi:RHS repeat-associated protein
MNLGNGTSESFDYNDRFQMTSQNLNKGSQVLQKYDYGYGKVDLANGTIDATKNNGQLSRIESFIGTEKQSQKRFEYDSIGRLSEAREYRGDNNSLTYKEHFDFDRFGNLYRKAINNGTSGQSNPLAYTPIEDNQIEKTTNRFTSATGTTYNEAGMVVADNKFRSMGFSYDANGRQVKATKANTSDAWSVYDALGNRVATKVNDVWQFVIYDAFGKLVAEYGTQSEGLGGVSYVLQDWQGSVRASVNANGFIQARFDFTAFGEEVSLGVGLRSLEQGYTGDATTKQGYGLTEKDSSGQNHTWFRKQENRAGRWTSPDPYKGSMSLGNPQSFNRYSYVESQPTNFVDPSGLQLRYYDVLRGMSCVVIDGVNHCTQFIDRYWYDDGIGGGGGGGDPFLDFIISVILPRRDAFNRAKEILQTQTRCADFIKSLLNHAFSIVETQMRPFGDNRITMRPPWIQNLDGSRTDLLNANYGLNLYDKAIGSNITGSGKSGVKGDVTTYGTTTNNTQIAWNNEFYSLSVGAAALHIIHESLHLEAGFSDYVLAQAASLAAGGNGSFNGDASQSLNAEIARYCNP